MNQGDLRRTYEALLARYEAGELDSEAFLLQVQTLSYRDEAGRLWTIGARSGKWYLLHQGRWVRADPASPPTADPTPPVDPAIRPAMQAAPHRRACPACRAVVAQDAAYCPHCGHALPRAQDEPESVRAAALPHSPADSGPRRVWIRRLPWLIGVLLLVGGVALAAVYRRPAAAPAPPVTPIAQASPQALEQAQSGHLPQGVVIVVAPQSPTAELVATAVPSPLAGGRFTITATQPKDGSVWYGQEITLRWQCAPTPSAAMEFVVTMWREGVAEPSVELRTSQTHHALSLAASESGRYQWQVHVVQRDAPHEVLGSSPRWDLTWLPDLSPTLPVVPTATSSTAPPPPSSTVTAVSRTWTLLSPSEGPGWIHGDIVPLRWQCSPGLALGEIFSLRIMYEGSPQPVLADHRTTSTSYDFRPDPLKTGRYDWEVLILRADTSQIVDRHGWHFSWSASAPQAPGAPIQPSPPEATATNAPAPTATHIPAPPPTDTPLPPATDTPVPAATPQPTSTPVPAPTATLVPLPPPTVPPATSYP